MGILLTLAAFVVLGGGGLYFTVSGGTYLRTYLQLSRSDPNQIREVTEQSGPVEVVGTARTHGQTDRSPFTDTETLMHEWEIWEGTGRSPDKLDWGTAKNPFLLDHATGTVLVEPDGASLQIERTTEIEVGPDETPPAPIAELLDSADNLSADSSRKRFFRESCLEPGDDVHVYGPLRAANPAEDVPRDVDALFGSNDLEDGPVDVTNVTLSGIAERTRADLERWFVITKGGEQTAARELRNKGLGWIALGVPLMALPVAMVLFT